MSVLIERTVALYNFVINDHADPRVADYSLLSVPFLIGVIASYNVCVQYILPWWMKGRPPFILKNIIVVYDVLQIIFNAYLFVRVLRLTYLKGHYSIICQGIEKGTSPEEIMLIDTVYLFYFVKLFDLLDTVWCMKSVRYETLRSCCADDLLNTIDLKQLEPEHSAGNFVHQYLTLSLLTTCPCIGYDIKVFFVLTKKSGHLSFLHIYHHSIMVLAGWMGVKYVPGGQSVVFGAINGFVHTFMYIYYLLAALKYIDARHIIWKRSLTQLQMMQFGLNMLHQSSAIFTDCNYPKVISFLLVTQNVLMFFLFKDFYRKAYVVKLKQKLS